MQAKEFHSMVSYLKLIWILIFNDFYIDISFLFIRISKEVETCITYLVMMRAADKFKKVLTLLLKIYQGNTSLLLAINSVCFCLLTQYFGKNSVNKKYLDFELGLRWKTLNLSSTYL